MQETPPIPPQRSGISVTEKDVATLNNYAEKKLQERTELSEVMSTVPSVVQRVGIYLMSAAVGFTAILLYFGRIPVWVNARGNIVPEVEYIPILAEESGVVTEVAAQVGQQLPQDATLLKIESTRSNLNPLSTPEQLNALQTLQAKELEIVREKVRLAQLELQLKSHSNLNNEQSQNISSNYQQKVVNLTKQLKDLQTEIANIQTKIDVRSPLTNEHKITMPQAGTLARLEVQNPGQLISQGTVVAVIIPAENSFIVKANVSEQDINSIVPGMEAQIKFDAYNFHQFGSIPAQVNQIFPDFERPGNFIVTLDLLEEIKQTGESIVLESNGW